MISSVIFIVYACVALMIMLDLCIEDDRISLIAIAVGLLWPFLALLAILIFSMPDQVNEEDKHER